MNDKAVGMDIAKNVFHVFTITEEGEPKKKKLVSQAKLGVSCRVQVPVGRGIRMISRKG